MRIHHDTVALRAGDALIIVDLQIDFLPGGALAVPQGDTVVSVMNAYLQRFEQHRLPIFATRDWHPPNHCSFQAQGGPWPSHCVADSPGAQFAAALRLPATVQVISKAARADRDAYSGFEGTDLGVRLQEQHIRRLFIGGLATDYCVLSTVRDALKAGFIVFVLTDGIRAVNVQPQDGDTAQRTMWELGARPLRLDMIEP